MKKKSAKPCHDPASSPSHERELLRLRRLRGQIDGIERMIQEGRYCVDILQQLKAVRAAVRAVEGSILRTHLKACVKDAFASKKPGEADQKIEEITKLFDR